MSEEYYQSAYTGSQIDDAIGRITNGEIDKLAENAAASAKDAERSAENARLSALDASIQASDAIYAADLAMENAGLAADAAQSSASSAFAAKNSETNAKLGEESANRSKEMADNAATLAAQKAMEAAGYASDVPPLIVERVTGEVIYVSDSAERPLKGLRLFGKTTQDGTPSPEAPVELVSVGNGGTVEVTVGEQTLTVQTPNGLSSVPAPNGGNYTDENGKQRVCDEVDFSRGVRVQRAYTVVLDGTESYKLTQHNNAGRFQITKASMPKSLTYNLGLCSHFKFSQAPIAGNDVDMAITVYETNLYLRYDARTSEAALVAFMQEQAAKGTPCTVKYLLAEPIETPLSAEELAAYAALHTNYPNTTVLNDGGAGMELAYVADTKNYIDNKFAELAAAIVNNA